MKKRLIFILLFFVICGLFVAIFYPVLTLGSGEDSWNTKASMNQARAGLGVVVVDGKIYAIGGYIVDNKDTINYVGTNERYDPETDTWITLKSMPTPRTLFAIAAYENKIYCISGRSVDEYADLGWWQGYIPHYSGDVEVYDTIMDSWSTKSIAPFFGSAHANVVDGKFFITHEREMYLYDPVADSWTKKTDIPNWWVSAHISAVVDSKIIFSLAAYSDHAVDGFPKNVVTIYDTKTDTYSEGSRPPMVLFDYAIAAVATSGVYTPQRVYILHIKSNNVYDPASDTWSNAKSSHVHRENFGAATVDDVIYVIGGQTHKSDIFGRFSSYKVLSTNQQYTPIDYSGAVTTPEPFLNVRTITALTLIVGGVTCIACFFISKKRKR